MTTTEDIFAQGLAAGVLVLAVIWFVGRAIGWAVDLVVDIVFRARAERAGRSAAQAVAFGLGGFAGTVAVDLTRAISGSTSIAYGGVFLLEGLIFLVAAAIALSIAPVRGSRSAKDDAYRDSAAGGLQAAE